MSSLPLLGAPPVTPTPRGGALGAKGFRPFFLLAGGFAASILPVWLLSLSGWVRADAYFDAFGWHSHEMVFGFSVAVIAGFLLTAAANWTARETLTGFPLLALAALWVAARVGFLVPHLPRGIPAALDLAFLPIVAIAIGRPIVAAKSHRNLVMVVVLLALWTANLAMHLDVLGVLPGLRRRGALVGVDLVLVLIVVMAGRIFPMFTKNATRVATIRSHPRLDAIAVASMASLTMLDALIPDSIATTVVAAVAGVFVVARAAHWGTRHVLGEPLLWILHATYAWVPIGLALRVASGVTSLVPAPLATHAFTVGAIGGMTLGMMARVGLGHTGRKLEVGRAMTLAFSLVTLSAVVRVGLPLAASGLTRAAVHASGTLWSLAFLVFVAVYRPILARPRADGKPG